MQRVVERIVSGMPEAKLREEQVDAPLPQGGTLGNRRLGKDLKGATQLPHAASHSTVERTVKDEDMNVDVLVTQLTRQARKAPELGEEDVDRSIGNLRRLGAQADDVVTRRRETFFDKEMGRRLGLPCYLPQGRLRRNAPSDHERRRIG